MTITTEESKLLEQRTDLTSAESWVLKDTLSDLRVNASVYEIRLANDDRAARFEAALIRFILESR
jgi:hypothetical protein